MATRGHLIGDSLEMGVLGHLTYSYGVPTVESKELINFDVEFDIYISTATGPSNGGSPYDLRTALSVSYLRCQQFTATGPAVSKIDVPIFRENAATQNCILQIRELVFDGTLWIPTGTILAEIIILPGDVGQYVWSPPVSIPWFEWTLSSPLTLQIGKMYGILAYSLETAANIWRWGIANGSFYPGGNFVFSNNGGGSWSEYSTQYDLPFKVYNASYAYYHDHKIDFLLELDELYEVRSDILADSQSNPLDSNVVVGPNNWVAAPFTIAKSAYLKDIDVCVYREVSSNAIVKVSIYDGDINGPKEEYWSSYIQDGLLSDLLPSWGNNMLRVREFHNFPWLVANKQYFLVISADDSNNKIHFGYKANTTGKYIMTSSNQGQSWNKLNDYGPWYMIRIFDKRMCNIVAMESEIMSTNPSNIVPWEGPNVRASGSTNDLLYSSWYAQQITPQHSGKFVMLWSWIWLDNYSTITAPPSPKSIVNVDLYNTSGGVPTGSPLAHGEINTDDMYYLVKIPGNNISTNKRVIFVPMNPVITLQAGTMYILVWGTNSTVTYMNLEMRTPSYPTSLGVGLHSIDRGQSWHSQTSNMQCAVCYGDELVVTPPVEGLDLEYVDSVGFELEIVEEESEGLGVF